MTAQELVQCANDAWNRRDRATWRSLVSDGFTFNGLQIGPDGWAQILDDWSQAIPDNRFTIESMVSDGSGIAVEYTFTGTQSGTLPAAPDGSQPELPPTGKPLEYHIAALMRIESDKVVTFAVYGVSGSMIQAGMGGLAVTLNGVPVHMTMQPDVAGAGLRRRPVTA